MSRSKESSSRLHEKHQVILADLLRDEDNKYCADCMAKGPRWASWNLGVFMCIRCAGIHRNLGVHVSRVKSVNLDSWTPEQIESIQKGGNRHAKNLYEANLPANFRRPQDDYAVEQFIRAKYERKMYIAKGEVKSSKEPAPTQEQKCKATKPKKVLSTSSNSIKTTGQDQNLAVPRPSGRHSPSSLATSKSAPSSTRNSASNLLTLDSSSSSHQTAPKSQPQPLLDLLTGSTPSSVAPPTTKPASTSTSFSQSSDPFSSSTSSSSASAAAANSTQDSIFGASPAPQVGVGQQQQQQQQQQQPTGSKESIMSLYSQHQPQYSSYTAQGYPVNNYYYQQQQAAAMHMAQVAALQQQQVNQVTAQMQKIKMNQTGGPVGAPQAFPGTMSNGGGFAASSGSAGVGMNMANRGAGGQTLNPTLW